MPYLGIYLNCPTDSFVFDVVMQSYGVSLSTGYSSIGFIF